MPAKNSRCCVNPFKRRGHSQCYRGIRRVSKGLAPMSSLVKEGQYICSSCRHKLIRSYKNVKVESVPSRVSKGDTNLAPSEPGTPETSSIPNRTKESPYTLRSTLPATPSASPPPPPPSPPLVSVLPSSRNSEEKKKAAPEKKNSAT